MVKGLRILILMVLGISFLFFMAGCGAEKKPQNTSTKSAALEDESAGKVLKLGRITYLDPREMIKQHKPLLDYLANRLKKYGYKKVKLVLAKDYEGVLKKLLRGDIDVAWLGTAVYAQLLNQGKELPVLVRAVWKGKPTYKGMIVVRADSPINAIKDLKGKKFAFVDEHSASGFEYPFALLVENGINPRTDFAQIGFLKQHDRVLKAVFLGKFDAGAVYKDARKRIKDEIPPSKFKIIAETKNIPNEPIVVRKDLSENVKEEIKKALLDLKIDDPQSRKILKSFGELTGFIEASPKDYYYAAKVLRIIKKYWH